MAFFHASSDLIRSSTSHKLSSQLSGEVNPDQTFNNFTKYLPNEIILYIIPLFVGTSTRRVVYDCNLVRAKYAILGYRCYRQISLQEGTQRAPVLSCRSTLPVMQMTQDES